MCASSSTSSILKWTPICRDNALNILIIYDLDKEKTILVEALKNTKSSKKLQIHSASSLPLSEIEYQNHFNYVIFLIDITRRYSFKVFKKIIRLIDIEFLMGRSLIICVNMSQLDKACFSYDHVKEIQNTYQTRVIHGDFSIKQGIEYMINTIMISINKAFEE